ncbi:hypothetical protein AB0H34_42975 [Saccharopolyspora shandongensis]|uniref:tyrosine-type recombinase/integrase n=1 Tax=Saccharopolyspora shandongensis TaxID=418495 RepID=UPI00340E418C
MYTSYDVKIRKTWVYRGKRGNTYYVRWRVENEPFKRPFANSTLAKSFRSKLVAAASEGEAFRTDTGLPVSMERPKREISFYALALDYVAMKWPQAAATYRRTIAEALTAATPVMLKDGNGKPDDATIRSALGWAFNLSKREREDKPDHIAKALFWIERNSYPLTYVLRPMTAQALHDATVTRLDGKPSAKSVARQRRMIVSNMLKHAVKVELLHSNPLKEIEWTAPKPSRAIDRRRVPNPVQVRTLLREMLQVRRSGPKLYACFASMYFGALRPEEAVDLRKPFLKLPEPTWSEAKNDWVYGWGEIYIEDAAPHAGSSWTDAGQPRDRRGLKHRPRGEGRHVPCPPELTKILREHLTKYGVASDGRLFRGEDGREVPSITWNRVWTRARRATFTEEALATPLAGRPYDLRHAAVSTWLNGGVDAPQVAEWAGHSVEVLLDVYAKCLDGQERVARDKVQRALGHRPAG